MGVGVYNPRSRPSRQPLVLSELVKRRLCSKDGRRGGEQCSLANVETLCLVFGARGTVEHILLLAQGRGSIRRKKKGISPIAYV